MIGSEITIIGDPCSITACYVTGGELVGSVEKDAPTYTASYYLNNGDITGVGNSSTVSDWPGAAQSMNSSLGNKDYQWVVNTVTDDDPRPLVIKTQTTN